MEGIIEWLKAGAVEVSIGEGVTGQSLNSKRYPLISISYCRRHLHRMIPLGSCVDRQNFQELDLDLALLLKVRQLHRLAIKYIHHS